MKQINIEQKEKVTPHYLKLRQWAKLSTAGLRF
jgi:hypothetical protein